MKSNEDFFNDMYEKTFCSLRTYARRHSCHPDFVDDILQEVYLEAFRHMETLRTHENHIGWLYKTAEHKTLKFNGSYYANAAHETIYNENDMENMFPVFDEPAAIRFEEYRTILSPGEYDLLIKRYRDNLSYKELATITHVSVAGTRTKVSPYH